MKIEKPWLKYETFDGHHIMQRLERACRTCYRSEDLTTATSYQKLLLTCIRRGHESILEHEKISIRMHCDIGVYKDLTRHRTGTAFSIESTRYCNYSKSKFENHLHFIEPIWITNPKNYQIWKQTMQNIETAYLNMAKEQATGDELRMILPHSTAAEVTMTCNLREWRHILTLRCSKMAHPSIRQLLIPLLLLFKTKMPELFSDIPFDEDFPKEWYAKISEGNS